MKLLSAVTYKFLAKKSAEVSAALDEATAAAAVGVVAVVGAAVVRAVGFCEFAPSEG